MKNVLRYTALCLVILISTVAHTYSQRWESVNLPTGFGDAYWYDIYFLPSNPMFGWACGSGGRVVRTTDGGTTWNGATVPFTSSNGHLESIHFTNTTVGYTSGQVGVFKTTDGGASWRDITPTTAGTNIWGTYFVSADTGMVIGGGCNGPNYVRYFFRTTNGGLTWGRFRDSTLVDASGLTDVYLTSATGMGWAMSSGYMWETSDGGATWGVKSSTGGIAWHEEFTKFNYSHLIPTAGINCSGDEGNIGGIRFSIDDGNTWNNFTVGGEMYGTFLLGEQKGWAVGVKSQVYYTSDAGASWAPRNCGIKADCDDIWFIDDSTGWIAADKAIYRLRPPYRSTSKVALNYGERCFPSESYDTLYIRLQSFFTEIADIQISGTDAGDFSVFNTPIPATVKNCDSTRLIIKFKPTTTGEKSAMLRITYGNPPSVFEIPLSGKAEGLTAQAIDTLLDFQSVPCGKTTQKAINIINGAVQQVTVRKAEKIKTDNMYNFVSALPLTIPPASSDQLLFSVRPADTGWVENQYKILINSCDFFVKVRAYGKSPIVKHPATFSIKAQCTNALIDSIPIENTGNSPLQIYTLNISTTDPQNFSIVGWNAQGDRTITIPPKQKAWLKIKYILTVATKTSKAILQFTCNDSTTTRGTKTAFSIDVDAHFAGPIIDADKGPINVGDICIGDEKRATFTVRNIGTTHAVMTYIGTSHNRARVLWREGFPAPQQLANEDSAHVSVIFKATKEGIIHDTVELRFQPCGEFIRIPVYCTGKNVILVSQPDTLKGTIVAGKPVRRTVTIRNTGSAVAEINSVYLDPAFPDWKIIDLPSPFLIAPGGDYVCTIEMLTFEEKVFRGQICFVANKECLAIRCVPFILQSITSGIGISVTEITFPMQQCIARTDSKEFTITNEGSLPDTITEISLLNNTTGDFSLIHSLQLPHILKGGETITIKVEYLPKAEGTHSAEIQIRSVRSTIPFVLSVSSSYLSAKTVADINDIDFGVKELCSNPMSRTITFTNTGLLQDTVLITRTNPKNGISISATQIIVPPNSSSTLIITVNPDDMGIGIYNEIITYSTKVCPAQGSITVKGEYFIPRIEVTPDNVTMDDVLLYENRDTPIMIKNNSPINRQVYYILSGNNYTIISAPTNPFEIAAGGTESVIIRFSSEESGTYNASLFVRAVSDCKDSMTVPILATIPDVRYTNTVSMKKHSVGFGTLIDLPLWQKGDIVDAECDSVSVTISINNKMFDVRGVKRNTGNNFTDIPYTLSGDTISLTLRRKDGIDITANDTLFYINGYTLSHIINKTPLFIDKYTVHSRRAVQTQKINGELEIIYGCLVAVPVPIGNIQAQIVEHNDNSIAVQYSSSFGTSPVRLSITSMPGTEILSTAWLQATVTPQHIYIPEQLNTGVYFLTVQTAYSTTHHKFIVY